MLPKRRKAPRMGVREDTRIDCQGHLKWLRGNICLIAGKNGHVCWGKMVAHHVRKGTHTGMSDLPDDSEAIPLCDGAHEEVHRGHETFQRKYGLNLSREAADAWRVSPHGIRWRASHE